MQAYSRNGGAQRPRGIGGSMPPPGAALGRGGTRGGSAKHCLHAPLRGLIDGDAGWEREARAEAVRP